MNKNKIEEPLFLEGEEWRDIKDYEGLYQVSSLGRVKSLARKVGKGRPVPEKILKQKTEKVGYITVCLCKKGKEKTCKVHRLVATAFIPNPENKSQVNHINSIRSDNTLINLEWASALENIRHAWKREGRVSINKGKKGAEAGWAKPINQLDLQGNFIRRWSSASEVHETLGIHASSITKVCKGKAKTCGGFIWEYAI